MNLAERREVVDAVEDRIRRVPFEMLRGTVEGTPADGYRGPDLDEVRFLLAYEGHWLDALTRLVAFSAVAVQRIAQHDERPPVEVLAELWPNP